MDLFQATKRNKGNWQGRMLIDNDSPNGVNPGSFDVDEAKFGRRRAS